MVEPSTAPGNVSYNRLGDTAPSKYDTIRAVLTTTKAKIITVIVASTLIITAVLIRLDVHQSNHHYFNTIMGDRTHIDRTILFTWVIIIIIGGFYLSKISLSKNYYPHYHKSHKQIKTMA
eukprot:258322_1